MINILLCKQGIRHFLLGTRRFSHLPANDAGGVPQHPPAGGPGSAALCGGRDATDNKPAARQKRGERGIALMMVLAFMAVSVPLVTGALALASNLSIDSGVKERIAQRQYSLFGASQHAIYKLVYEEGYLDGLEEGVEYSYAVELNGQTLTVTVMKLVSPAGEPFPPPAYSNRRLRTLKEVVDAPATVNPGEPATFTYSIVVENADDQAEDVRKVHDALPPGFSYVPGTTSGVTTNNPEITTFTGGDGQTYEKLVWNLAPLKINLLPGESITLDFSAEATLEEGNYCNEAWAEPGDELTSTGLTAKITVGTPPTTLCPGEAATVTKAVSPAVAAGGSAHTYTYTIDITNIGEETLHMSNVRELLPVGFFYVEGSATLEGSSLDDPVAVMHLGRQRLDWAFAPSYTVGPGAELTLVFQASANVDPGEYWNDVLVTFEELDYEVYTWPTALVLVMGVASTSVTDGQGTAKGEVWLGSGMWGLAKWYLTR